MIKLIKAELKKIFHKKSFYIVTILFILYAVLINFLYKNANSYVYEDTIDIQEYKDVNASLNLNKEEDVLEYISNLAIIKREELKNDCLSTNCEYIIDYFLYDLLYNAYEEKYLNQNEVNYEDLRNAIDVYIAKIKQDDWQYFTNLKITELKNNLENITDIITMERYKEIIQLEEYRLKHNVDYNSNNYLNNAIIELEENLFEYYNLKNKDNLTKDEEERFLYLEELYLTNNYVLNYQKDVNNSGTLQSVLKNFSLEFGLFILIYVVMISGSIISEEFNKGTIKYLLTKPYKRSTILTSKILTILILIPILIIMMALIQVLVGGIILGFHSLSTPVLIYSATAHRLVEMSIITYFLKMFVCTLPIYIVLGALCFMLSTITCSTSAAITITFLFYLVCNVVNNLAAYYNWKIFKAFVSLHWDFSYLVNLTPQPYHINPWISVLVVLVYISVMLCIAYVYFNKKDVKNI